MANTDQEATHSTVRVRTTALQKIKHAGVTMTGPVGRKLSNSDVIDAAITVALQHPDEYTAALRSPGQE